MEIILIIATLIGGFTGAWFLWDKFWPKETIVVEDKLVDNAWWERSSTKEGLAQKGYEFRWSNVDKVASRKQDGYQVIYEHTNGKKLRLVNKSGKVLIGKRTKKNT